MTGFGFSDVLLEEDYNRFADRINEWEKLWLNFKLSQNLDRGNLSITV